MMQNFILHICQRKASNNTDSKETQKQYKKPVKVIIKESVQE